MRLISNRVDWFPCLPKRPLRHVVTEKRIAIGVDDGFYSDIVRICREPINLERIKNHSSSSMGKPWKIFPPRKLFFFRSLARRTRTFFRFFFTSTSNKFSCELESRKKSENFFFISFSTRQQNCFIFFSLSLCWNRMWKYSEKNVYKTGSSFLQPWLRTKNLMPSWHVAKLYVFSSISVHSFSRVAQGRCLFLDGEKKRDGVAEETLDFIPFKDRSLTL